MKEIKAAMMKYRKLMLGIVLLTVAGVVMEIGIPLVVAVMIDRIYFLPYHNYLAIILLILIIGGFLSGIIAYCWGASVSAGFARELRAATYRNVQLLSVADLDRLTGISIVTRLTTDITNLQNSVHTTFHVFIRSLIVMIATLIAAVLIAPVPGGVFLVLVILAVVMVLYVSKKAMPLFSEGLTVYDRLNRSIQENVTAARVIKAYNKESRETARFSAGSQLMYELFVKAEKVMVLANPILLLAINTCLVLVVWVGSKQIIGGTMSTGNFTLLITYTTYLLTALLGVTRALASILSSLPSLQRVAEISEMADEPEQPQRAITMKDGRIELRQVSFRYDQKNSKYDLKDINIVIHSGETIGMIGGTGSGKSTLAQLIAGLYEPETGEIIIGGYPVREYQDEELKRNISIALQKSRLFSGSIADNLKWGNPYADQDVIRQALEHAEAEQFVAGLEDGWDTWVEQGGTNFSGGQRQRLSIARALLKHFRILVLDDATSAIDSATEKAIRVQLKTFYPAATKLIISQKVSQVSDCDRIIVLEHGQVCGFAAHEELCRSNRIYQEICSSQQGGGDFDVG